MVHRTPTTLAPIPRADRPDVRSRRRGDDALGRPTRIAQNITDHSSRYALGNRHSVRLRTCSGRTQHHLSASEGGRSICVRYRVSRPARWTDEYCHAGHDEPANAAVEVVGRLVGLLSHDEFVRRNLLSVLAPGFIRHDRRGVTPQPPADGEGWVATLANLAELPGRGRDIPTARGGRDAWRTPRCGSHDGRSSRGC
jgi:hypothetical protein